MVEQIGQRTAHRLIGQPRPQHSAGLVASDQVVTLESPKCIHIDNFDAGNIPMVPKVASRRRQRLSLVMKKNAPAREEAEALNDDDFLGSEAQWNRKPG